MCGGLPLVGWSLCRWGFSLTPFFSLCLFCCSLACHSHQRHICMCKKALCWSAAAIPPPSPHSATCLRFVYVPMKAPHPRPQSVSQTWYFVSTCNTCPFQPPGLFPGDVSAQEGVRKWHAGHSCLSRFPPSMFAFLFPYSGSIWMEPNLESRGDVFEGQSGYFRSTYPQRCTWEPNVRHYF